MKKILLVGAAADRYGADEMLLRVARHAASKHDVTVVLPEEGPLCQAMGQDVPHLHQATAVVRKSVLRPGAMMAFLACFPIAVFNAWRVIHRRRPDLVWVNTITVPAWIWAAKLAGVPVVCHSHEIVGGRRWPRRILYLPLLLCDRIVVVSRAVAEDIADVYRKAENRCEIVLNPAFEFPEGLDIDDGRDLDLVVIGRLSPRKGQEVLVDALPLVAHKSDLRVHFCGTVFPGYEWYEERLRQASASAVGHVEFHGYQAKADAFRLGGIVVVPSTGTEACPLVVLEAMAAGRIVIATSVGGIPELVGDTGFLVPPSDPGALAAAIATVMAASAEDRLKWVEMAQVRARTLSPSRFFARIDQVFVRSMDAKAKSLARPATRRGAWVCIAGPDGVGKTTLVRDLLASGAFTGTRHRHWRPGVLPALHTLRGTEDRVASESPHSIPPYKGLGLRIRLLYYWLDFVLGYCLSIRRSRARGELYVLERGWWDMVVDRRRYLLTRSPLLERILTRLMPRPDTYLILDASPDRVLTRKAELPREELTRQRQAWLNVAEKLPCAALVDAERSPEVVLASALRAIARREGRS